MPDPGPLGEDLERLAGEQMAAGLAGAMQLVVAHGDRIVVDRALGSATPGSRFHLMSATKPVTAAALHRMVERGLVSYADPVARHLPAFAAGGKESVTIHQALSHQGGFPDLTGAAAAACLLGTWEDGIAAVCDLPLETAPGSAVIYHPLSASLAVAAVVEAVAGRPFPDVVQDEVLDPLGMSSTTWGVPPEAAGAVAECRGADAEMEQAVAPWRDPTVRTKVVPGGGLFGPAGDLVRFYLALRGGAPALGVPALLAPATVRHATALHAPMAPGSTWGFGLGFMVGTQPGVNLSRGQLGSPRAYGHPGHCSIQALADPAADVVMAFFADVAPQQSESDRRFGILCDAVYRALAQ